MLLNEIFDSVVAIKWSKRSSTVVGDFSVDGLDFRILLEPATFTFNDTVYDFINVSFVRKDGEIETTDLLGQTKTSAKIYGAILNGVKSQLKKYTYDALVFIATDNVEKRMSLYDSLVNRFMKDKLTNVIRDIPLNDGHKCIVAFSTEMKNPRLIVDFKEFLKSVDKQ